VLFLRGNIYVTPPSTIWTTPPTLDITPADLATLHSDSTDALKGGSVYANTHSSRNKYAAWKCIQRTSWCLASSSLRFNRHTCVTYRTSMNITLSTLELYHCEVINNDFPLAEKYKKTAFTGLSYSYIEHSNVKINKIMHPIYIYSTYILYILYTYICVYIYTYIYTYMYTHIYIYIQYIYIYIYSYIYIYIYIYIFIYIYMEWILYLFMGSIFSHRHIFIYI